jgi:hypothetical protein
MRPQDLPPWSKLPSRWWPLAFLAPIGKCQTWPSLPNSQHVSTAKHQIIICAHNVPHTSRSNPKLPTCTLSFSSICHGRARLGRGSQTRPQTSPIQLAENPISNPLQFRIGAALARSPGSRRSARSARRLRTNVCGCRTICQMDANASAIGGRTCCFW